MAMSFDMQIIKQSVLSSNIIYVILFVYILQYGNLGDVWNFIVLE